MLRRLGAAKCRAKFKSCGDSPHVVLEGERLVRGVISAGEVELAQQAKSSMPPAVILCYTISKHPVREVKTNLLTRQNIAR